MRKNFDDLTGKRFGRLTVISWAECRQGNTYWNCLCDCGKTKVVSRSSLISKKQKSCGCLLAELSGKRAAKLFRTHGMRRTRLYYIWCSMKDRCNNKNNHCYERYGGRGISVCDEWQHFEPFRDWAFANGYADNLSIERIDCNGNYEPNNCTWIPLADQNKNTRASRRITINGTTHILADWARLSELCPQTISYRIKKGYPESEWLKPSGKLNINSKTQCM